jgi:hypothetical protein
MVSWRTNSIEQRVHFSIAHPVEDGFTEDFSMDFLAVRRLCAKLIAGVDAAGGVTRKPVTANVEQAGDDVVI